MPKDKDGNLTLKGRQRNYLFLESPDTEATIDIASVDGSKEATVKITRNGSTLEVVVTTNEVDDYAITFEEISVDLKVE